MHSQRVIYSLLGLDEECKYLYIINIYQSIFEKTLHPLFSEENEFGKDIIFINYIGIHDDSIFVDPKEVVVVLGKKIFWSMLKMEDAIQAYRSEEKLINIIRGVD